MSKIEEIKKYFERLGDTSYVGLDTTELLLNYIHILEDENEGLIKDINELDNEVEDLKEQIDNWECTFRDLPEDLKEKIEEHCENLPDY